MKLINWTVAKTAVVSALLVTLFAFKPNASAAEFRGLWVDSFGSGFFTSNEVAQLLADCKNYNFNAVVVEMRRRGDAFYIPHAPNGDPKTTAIASNFDALGELIKQAHASNPRIEVHCWAVANLIWSGSSAPTQSGHVFNLHPEYLTKSSGGVTQFSEGYFLDPGHPDAMQWNYNMAKDIVSHYDIDGFHWDYIRYPQQDAGFNATAIARYKAEFGVSTTPSYTSSQFTTWRTRQVTDFLRWVNADLLEIKPNLVISAAVFANRTDALNNRFQDWAGWSKEGLLDVFMPMNYSSDNATFTSRVDDAFKNVGIRTCYMGQGAYLNAKENTLTQLNYIRNKPMSGSLFYSYRTPNSGTVDQDGTLQYIKDNFQPTWQDTPTLPWVANPTNAILKGTVINQNGGATLYNAKVFLTGSRTLLTEPHGKYAFYEVPVGSYSMKAVYAGITSAPVNVTVTAGGIFNADISINLPATPDTTAPVISGVTASSLSSNSVTITWVTDEASDGLVEYGLSANYGSTAVNGTSVTSHGVVLTGLTPMTSYNYRVTSRDAAGNLATSANFQFTTMPANSDIIVDNPAATIAGTWTLASSATDRFGADYRFKSRGTGSASLQFTPNIPVNGNYQVFEWHSQGSNRPTNAPVIVTSVSGTQTVSINQQTNGGKWVYIGTFNFLAGTSGNVKITDGFTGPTNGVVMADAVRFIYVPDGTSSELIIDNTSAVFTGTWSLATTSTDRFGADYRFKSKGTGTAFATYSPTIAVSGNYDVYEMHPAGSNRGQNVPHIVTYGDGTQTQTVLVNQQVNGGKWNYIGTFSFGTGLAANVKLTDGLTLPTNGVVMADAIRFVFAAPTPAPNEPSNVNATALSSTQIRIDWTDASANESKFIVARSTTAGGPYTDIATLNANTITYTDSGLTAGTTYYYVVRATGNTGTSENSNEDSATTLQLPPAAPSLLGAAPNSASQINLQWVDNDGSQDLEFVISRSADPNGPFTDITTVPSQVVTFSDTGLDASTTYYYRVRARNSGGDSANSNVAGATTFPAPPAAPINASATALSSSSIRISWSEASADVQSFIISRSAGLGNLVDIATVAAGVSSYTDSGLAAHTTYFYGVRAANSGGSSSATIVNATTFNNAPTASASAPATVSADGNCQATVVLDGSASTDPDGDSLSYSWSGPFGTAVGVSPSVILPVGSSTISLTVNDGHGGSSSASVTVTIADTTAPTITMLGANPLLVQCATFFTDPGATAADSCSGDLTSTIHVSSDVNPYVVGDYVVTYSVTDQAGNIAAVSRLVRVIDTMPPVVTLVGSNPMTVEAADAFVDPGVSACDICDPNVTTSVSGSVNTLALGTYTLTYTATDASGNSAVLTRTVNVVDTTAPVLTLNGHSSATIECHSSFVDEGATAIDSFAGDLTSQIAVYGSVDPNTPGIYTISYSVVDPSGNTAGAERTIYVVDTLPPSITLNGASAMTVEANSSFVDPGASATDVCAGDLSSAITVSGSVDTATVGTYTITYSVADAAGNQAVATRTVKVVDTTAPTVALNGANFMTVECHGSFADPGATAFDKVSGDLSATIKVTGSVDTTVPGTYTLTYTATDASGNTSSATRTVQVSDTTAPNFTGIAATPSILTAANHTMVAVTISASVIDGCDSAASVQILSVKCNQPVNSIGDGNTSPDWQITGPMTLNLRAERSGALGDRIYTVTVEAVDASGNVSTKNVAVTVPHDKAK